MDGEITIGTKLSTDKFDRQIADLEKKMKKEEDKKIEIEAKIKDVSSEKIDRQIQRIKDKIEKTTNAPTTLKVNADIAKMEKELQQYDLAKQKAKEYKQQLDELEKKRMQMLVANPILAGRKATGEFKQVKDDIQEISKLLQQANRKILEGEPKIDQVSNSLDRLKEKQSSITNKILEYKNTLDTLNTQRQQEINNKTEQYKKQLQEINQNVSEYKQKIENVKIQKQVADVEKLKNSFNSVGSSIQKSIKNVAKLALGIFGLRSAYMALRRASSDLASYDQQYATNLEYIRYALTQGIAPVLRYIVNLAAKLLGYINAIMQGWFGINLFSRGSAESFNKMKSGAGGALKAVKEIKKQLAGFDEINMLTDQSDTGTSAGAGGVGMPSFDLSALNAEPPKWLQWIIDNKDGILSTLAGIAGGLAFLKLGEIARDLGLIQGRLLGIKAIGFGLLIKGIIDLISSLRKYLKDPSWENFGKVIKSIGEIILGVGLLIGNVPLIVAGAITLIMGLIIQHWEDIKQFFQNGIDWLADKSDWVHEMFGDTIGNIYDTFVENLQLILDWFDMTFKNIKQILDGIIEFVTGVFSGDWEKAWEGVKKIFGGIWDWIKNTLETVLQIAWNSVKDIATGVGETISNVFKAIVNGVLSGVERILNSPIRAINNLIGTINEVPGINLGYLNTFSLPRMKQGGILNVPNKGTLVGGGRAIAGEGGHEGYIPLTDQQAMAELGAEIGRNVVVNLTNITKVGNRQIAREIKQINAENNFAYNA